MLKLWAKGLESKWTVQKKEPNDNLIPFLCEAVFPLDIYSYSKLAS